MLSKSLVYMVIIVVVVAAGALLYLQQSFADSAELGSLTSIDQIHGRSPTICMYDAEGSPDTTSSGVLRIYNNRLRIDMHLVGNLYTGELKVVIDDNGEYHWADPSIIRTWPINVSARQTIDDFLFSAKWRCSPWWFPSDALFDIEQNG